MIRALSSSIFTTHNNEIHVLENRPGFNILWNSFQEQDLEELYSLIYFLILKWMNNVNSSITISAK